MNLFVQYHSNDLLWPLPQSALLSQVGLQLLSRSASSSPNELFLHIDDLSLTWNTQDGDISEPNPIGNLSNWFSFVKDDEAGAISRVYFPQGESEMVLAFKKSLSQLISVGDVVERSVEEGGVHVVRERSEGVLQEGRRVTVVKVKS